MKQLIGTSKNLVSLKNISRRIICSKRVTKYLIQNEYQFYINKSVAEQLIKALDVLPKQYKFLIFEGYRPIEIQHIIYQKFLSRISKRYPNWNRKKTITYVNKFIAPIKPTPPHATGDTIDLTLVYKNGVKVDMGTSFNSFSPKSKTNYKNLSQKQRDNRSVLINAMKSAGFVNYTLEWWHWSLPKK